MEAYVYSKLEEDGVKKIIYKMARVRDDNYKDVKGGTVIKGRNGKLVTDQEVVLKVWESYLGEKQQGFRKGKGRLMGCLH